MRVIFVVLLAYTLALAQAPAPGSLAERIGHTDPAKRGSGRSHGSLGDMKCQTLVPRGVIPFLNFVHRCEMTAPDGGVGAHFHNTGEEMFVVFDGEAEFTIDGHTSLLKGHVVGAPLRMGHSHAIYNPGSQGVQFMNIQVGAVDGEASDAFNLGDPRKGAPKDSLPVFMSMHLEKTSPPQTQGRSGRGRGTAGRGGAGQWGATGALQEVQNYHGGKGAARYRRALHPVIFSTNWAYVDHLILSPGSADGKHRHPHVGEVYYVLDGSGEVTVNSETVAIRAGDAIPVRPDEAHSFANNSSGDLEFMIIGISTQKGVIDTVEAGISQ
ncbi:MAG: cupin domain-containing protein [Candidatus Korobacteraceae bacterium]